MKKNNLDENNLLVLDKMKYSPMIRQYLEFKEKYQDMILFYRVGDFYELFFNDAIVGSRELEIILTGKDAGVEDRIPMCGVPFHAVDGYLDTLVSKGYKVGIVEQVEDPSKASDIVRRELIRVVTPGTIMDDTGVDRGENNFLVAISFVKGNISNNVKDYFILSYLDLTTGEGYITNIPSSEELLYAEIIKLKAREIIISSSFNKSIFDNLKKTYNFLISIEDNVTLPSYFKNLVDTLNKEEVATYSRLLNYITRTQLRTLVHLQHVIKYDINSYLRIDIASRKNLELLETLRFQNKRNTLVSVLDQTVTAMGSRYLKKNILFPLIDKNAINNRFCIIDIIKKNYISASDLRKELSNVYDLERIVGKISYENANPKDMLQLKKSLNSVKVIKKLINKMELNKYYDFETDSEKIDSVYRLIDESIKEDAPFSLKDGGVIKDGYNKELDEVRSINKSGKNFILSLEQKERERTGIKTLKVGFNKVFGYYIEVSKGACSSITDDMGFIRKQTLVNAERFITQELKEKEALILRADEKMLELENDLFNEVRNKCKEYTSILQKLAKTISEVDMLMAFAKVSSENKYVRPNLNDDGVIEIVGGRHPVIEASIDNYIPNDVYLDDDKYIMIITGPNMSGKSTYMRQVALTALMAQIGCFVPAKSANLPIFDAIFTRIGASDDIVSGQSTFMVEMMEVNNALSSATKNSLVLFDEIGRGTATYDGMALAQAILEYVHENIKCKTMFSTHYHELTSLEDDLKHLKNVHVCAEETNGEIVFLHKIKDGAVDKSYGVNVAKLAKLPTEVIVRANDILTKLEDNNDFDKEKLSIKNYVAPLIFDSKSDLEKFVLDEIKDLNVYEMTPMDALNKLNELKNKLK